MTAKDYKLIGAARPSLTFDETVIDYINTKRCAAAHDLWNKVTARLAGDLARTNSLFDVKLFYAACGYEEYEE